MRQTSRTEAIEIKKPHEGQRQVLDSLSRFKVVCCGRRFGKTELAKRRLILQGYQNGKSVGYFCPTNKMLSKQWNAIVKTLSPVILKKDEHFRSLLLKTGGIIDFWSLENFDTIRGQAYHEAIIDEAAYVEDLLDIWEKTIRPTLTDYRGSATFLSTPNGFDNDFKKLFDFQEKFNNWESFKMPTWTNPRIPIDEIEEAKLQLPLDVFRQEYEADFILFTGKLFMDHFRPDVHIDADVTLIPHLEVYLAFDFNITPSCLIIQKSQGSLHVIREIHEPGWDLFRLCSELRSDYGNHNLIINGDASGYARNALTQGNINAYDIISSELGRDFEDFNVPSHNPSYINSRLQCNWVLKNISVKIHPSCKRLLHDIQSCKIDEKQSIETWKKKNPEDGHVFDCYRYHINAEWADRLQYVRNDL
ncbi:MAG: hypothetical protein J7604_03540 [Sporocytophaga sp.]|uniref:terminase large subunit domain-containing protein n=1 Tax=Sporocytophaga sp. TaxID=2231183 RepID=UPI001B1753B2|nr:terminase family protein [Sporocytophaga sp.]MBO9699254.1 hypothetical protein [Sporocytophaga sp.]